jgi:hypothetical protein
MTSAIAWAAGFFDGEGSTYVVVQHGRYAYLNMTVSQVDREPLDRFVELLGGRVNGPYVKGPQRSELYQWTLTGLPNTLRALHALWPYLTMAKRQQAVRAVRKLGPTRLVQLRRAA